jgi:hypothetical protein
LSGQRQNVHQAHRRNGFIGDIDARELPVLASSVYRDLVIAYS